jgi:outer membrane autotransporter protein
VQPGIVMTTTGGFAQSLLTRLAGTHEARAVADLGPAAAADAPMGLGASDKARAPQGGSSGRFTSFAMGTFLGGNRSESADAPGYDYDATSGTAGIEYSISRNLIMGVALNYTNLSADLRTGANVDLDAIQGSAYLSYATRQMFADALVAYGSHDINLNRPGAVDFLPIHSSTDASALALAARAGYLFDLGSLRAGPVAGLTYIHSRVGGYTETGDDLATFQVSSQTLDSVTGNMGLRFLAPFKTSGGSLVVPHLDILLEHQFGDHTQTLTTTLVQAPLLPIPTTLPAFNDRTYGRIEGGVTLQLTPDLSASVNAGTTFARDDGQDYRVSAGLNYRF